MKNNPFNTSLLALTFFFFLTLLLHSCKPLCERHPDDPECAGENELITTLRVIVADSATGVVLDTFQFKDADGNGSPEVFDTIRLNTQTTYRVLTQFLNESVTPVENINDEIEQEKNDHFVAYHVHNAAIGVSYIDYDNNTPPLPLGLQTYWRTGASGTGHVQVTLRHQPGVKDGTATPGDTDVQVEFAVEVQ